MADLSLSYIDDMKITVEGEAGEHSKISDLIIKFWEAVVGEDYVYNYMNQEIDIRDRIR